MYALPSTHQTRTQSMRTNPTREEALLWEHLKNKQLGYRFTRQQTLDKYIVDFYCAQAKLIIELDGLGHRFPLDTSMQRNAYNSAYYQHRKRTLRKAGYTILTFWNAEVRNETEKVIAKIDKFLTLLT